MSSTARKMTSTPSKQVNMQLATWPEKLRAKVKENPKRISALHIVEFRETEVIKSLKNMDACDVPYALAPASEKLLGEYLALQKKLTINPLELTPEVSHQLCDLVDAFDNKVKSYNKALVIYEDKIEEIKNAKEKVDT